MLDSPSQDTLIAILPHMYPETLHLSLQRRLFLHHYKDQITGPISLTPVHFGLDVTDQELQPPLVDARTSLGRSTGGFVSSILSWDSWGKLE